MFRSAELCLFAKFLRRREEGVRLRHNRIMPVAFTNDWDAQGYSHNARFVSDLGMAVVDLLAPRPGETILDLGCGDGALTANLAALGVAVTAIDSSPSMVAAAAKLGLNVHLADMHEFDLGRRFDAVFTNAVLHWTRDIDEVVGRVAKHMMPDGRFVGEFGGFGNVAAIVTAILASLALEGAPPSAFSWYFPTPEEFGEVLENAGFEIVSAQLIPRPTPLPAGMAGWLTTFARPFAGHLEADARKLVLARAEELLAGSLCDKSGAWTADYVRLRFHAVLRTPTSQA